MSLATLTAALLNEAGVTADDILNEAGINRTEAIRELSNKLGVDLSDLVETPSLPGPLVEVSDEDVATLRKANEISRRIFG